MAFASCFRADTRLALHVSTVLAFAMVQPLFDALGHNPSFFVARAYTAPGVVAFAVLAALFPLVLSFGLLWTVRAMSSRMSRPVGLTLLFFGLALFSAPICLSILGVHQGVLVSIASMTVGFVMLFVYLRSKLLRRLLQLLVCCHIIFPAWFLLGTPVMSFLYSPEEGEHASAVPSATRPGPVVVLVLDELPLASMMTPQFRIDAERFPQFARFAQQSTWYRNAMSVAPYTVQAVPSLLSGRYVDDVNVPNAYLGQQPNLFTMLPSDYSMAAFEHHTRLCPVGRCAVPPNARARTLWRQVRDDFVDASIVYAYHVTPVQFWPLLPNLIEVWGDFGRQMPFAKRQALVQTAIDRLDEQSLLYVHFPIPHHPFKYMSNGQMYLPMDGVPSGVGRMIDGAKNATAPYFWRDSWAALQVLQRHLMQAHVADREFGVLLDRLVRHPLYDQMTIVVVADHGMRFVGDQDGRSFEQGDDIGMAELLTVPFFVKYPNQQTGEVLDSPALTLDVVPTIIDQLGLESEFVFHGMPLREIAHDRERSVVWMKNEETERMQVNVTYRSLVYAIRTKERYFRDGATPFALDRVPSLRGRPVEDFPVSDNSDIQSTLMFAAPRRSFGELTIPGQRIKGKIDASRTGYLRSDVAVALNGVIVGTTLTQPYIDNESWFSMMIPNLPLKSKGGNVWETYLVIRDEGHVGTRLVRLDQVLQLISS